MNKKHIRTAVSLLFALSALVVHGQAIEQLITSQGAFRKDTLLTVKSRGGDTVLPVTVIKGEKEGPVFSIVAGIHGYEYPPIIAVQELLNEIEPKEVAGTLIIIPIANTAAFYGRTPFINPLDGKNLNNAFPGSATGTVTEQLAHLITREVIAHSDVFLDIHGGDANEDLLPFVCYYHRKDTPKQTALARELSEKSGFGHIVSYSYTITATQPALYAFKQAAQQGITALSIEAGKLGNVQAENVQATKQAVYNMLSHYGMHTGKSSRPRTATPVILDTQTYVRVPVEGIFYSPFKSGDEVTKGEILGYITDIFGSSKTEVSCPVDGIILYKIGTPPVNKGETLFCIGSSGD